MATSIWLQKVQSKSGIIGFVPTDRADELELERIPWDKELRADVTVPRSGPYHRLMFKTFTLIAKVLNDGPTNKDWSRDLVRRRLLAHLGYADVDWLPSSAAAHYADIPKGVPIVELVPKSMAFDKMEQDEAVRFFEAAMIYVISEFGPWVKDHPDWRHVVNIGMKLKLMPYPEETAHAPH